LLHLRRFLAQKVVPQVSSMTLAERSHGHLCPGVGYPTARFGTWTRCGNLTRTIRNSTRTLKRSNSDGRDSVADPTRCTVVELLPIGRHSSKSVSKTMGISHNVISF